MDIFDVFSLISSGVMFVGVIFAIYYTFRKPQDSLEKKQIIAGEELKDKATILAQTEAEGKAKVLAAQIESRNIENDRRFDEMAQRLDKSTTMAQNHIHTVDTKVETLTNMVNAMNLNITNELTKLGTTLNICFKDKNI